MLDTASGRRPICRLLSCRAELWSARGGHGIGERGAARKPAATPSEVALARRRQQRSESASHEQRTASGCSERRRSARLAGCSAAQAASASGRVVRGSRAEMRCQRCQRAWASVSQGQRAPQWQRTAAHATATPHGASSIRSTPQHRTRPALLTLCVPHEPTTRRAPALTHAAPPAAHHVHPHHLRTRWARARRDRLPTRASPLMRLARW
jgi:hypothetical protein